MAKQFLLPFLYLLLTSAAATGQPAAMQKCRSTPCANTPTGEDRGEMDARATNAELDMMWASSDDKFRWQTITLFSNSKEPGKQKLLVHKDSNTELALEADKGLIVLRTPQTVSAFQIASPPGGTDNLCPKYQIEIVDASAVHAIVKKICPKYEYGPGREFKSYDYYLYDRTTASMRSIWSGSALQNVSMLKSPQPDPLVTPTANGYKYQWKGQVALGGSVGNVSYNNLYERKKSKDGRLELVCRDMNVGKHGEIEGGSCEGGILDRIQVQARPAS